jgi:hypothetical protein
MSGRSCHRQPRANHQQADDRPFQLIDVHFPTTDKRTLIFSRYTQPDKDHKILLTQLGWELPEQAPPRITTEGQLTR